MSDFVVYGPINSSNGSVTIPELTSDPVSPAPESAWVLRTDVPEIIGSPIGLLLSLTYATSSLPTYQFSYQTLEGTIVRTQLS